MSGDVKVPRVHTCLFQNEVPVAVGYKKPRGYMKKRKPFDGSSDGKHL